MTVGWPTASMHTSAPNPPVESADGLDRVVDRGVDRGRGPEAPGQLQLPGVEVDGDDGGGPGQPGTGDRGAADASAPEHGHRVAGPDLAGQEGRPEAGHHPAAQQADGLGPGRRVDLGALAGRHQGLLGERPDAEGRG